jgi:hypothetical protein
MIPSIRAEQAPGAEFASTLFVAISFIENQDRFARPGLHGRAGVALLPRPRHGNAGPGFAMTNNCLFYPCVKPFPGAVYTQSTFRLHPNFIIFPYIHHYETAWVTQEWRRMNDRTVFIIPRRWDQSNWWLDLVLLLIFWAGFFPEFTGLELHQWLGIGAVLLATWHLIVHWPWVKNVTLRFFSLPSRQAHVFYAVDLGVMFGFFMILITGLLISTWLDLPWNDFASWMHIHLMVSIFTLGMIVLKLVLHWRWIAASARRNFFDRWSGRIGGGAPRTASPLDRRDFLKLSGVLGAATVFTIHNLFDGSGDGQASSAQSESQEIKAESADIVDAVKPTSTACIVRCPNGCSYPGRCQRYVDSNKNNLCDNGECL